MKNRLPLSVDQAVLVIYFPSVQSFNAVDANAVDSAGVLKQRVPKTHKSDGRSVCAGQVAVWCTRRGSRVFTELIASIWNMNRAFPNGHLKHHNYRVSILNTFNYVHLQ